MGKIRDFFTRNGLLQPVASAEVVQRDDNGRWLESANRGGGRRKSIYAENRSSRELITPFDRDTVVSVSTRLYMNNGLVRGAIDDKALHTCREAFRPQSLAKNRKWAREAEKWLETWFAQCEDGVPGMTFNDGCYLESVSIDREGDIGVVPVLRADGYPLIRHIPSWRMRPRIGQFTGGRDGQGVLLDKGPYTGNWLYDGVILNESGRPLAYFVAGRTPDTDRYVPARSLSLLYEPIFFDQVRGFPLFFHALNEIRESKQASDSERRALMQAGTQSLVYTNEKGAPPNTNDPSRYGADYASQDENGQVNSVTREVLDDGTITYRAPGEKGELFEYDRPAENWREYFDRVRREAMAGQTWPDELVYEIAKTNTNAIRLLLDKCQVSKDDRHGLLKPCALGKIRHGIVGAMDLGLLPWDDDWHLWTVSRSKDSTIDRGRDAQQIREDYRMGIINLGVVLAKTTGETVEEHWRARYSEEAIRMQVKAEVEAEFGGIEIDDSKVYVFNESAAQETEEDAPKDDKKEGEE